MGAIEESRFLKIFPFFQNASEILVENILSLSRYITLPGKMLVKLEGDPCLDFVLMLSGEKRIYMVGGPAREITLYEIGAGDICVLNASCILSHTKLPANAATTSDTEVLLLPAPHFLDMMATYQEMRTFVDTHINAGLTFIMGLISEIVFGKMDERLMNYLVEKSEDNTLRKTHQQIAQDLGTSREVVSRLLKDFERQGLIALSRSHIYLKHL